MSGWTPGSCGPNKPLKAPQKPISPLKCTWKSHDQYPQVETTCTTLMTKVQMNPSVPASQPPLTPPPPSADRPQASNPPST